MKKIILVVMMCLLVFTAVGCTVTEVEVQKKAVSPIQNDISTYSYSGDIRYIPVSQQIINDGTLDGIYMTVFVDRYTKVLYTLTEKYHMGYGISFVKMEDENNNSVLYDGNIETLIDELQISE